MLQAANLIPNLLTRKTALATTQHNSYPLITIIGLGPGRWEDLTIEALDILGKAGKVYFRTLVHPTTSEIEKCFPNLEMESFDSLYDQAEDWTKLYTEIADKIIALSEAEEVVYAVPGHPLVGESTVQLILQKASSRKIIVKISQGLSFIEPMLTALHIDAMQGLQIIDSTDLAGLDATEVAGKIIPTRPTIITQVYNRRMASAVKLALGEIFADEKKVTIISNAGISNLEKIVTIPLFEIDREDYTNHLTSLYVPAVEAMESMRIPETLRHIVAQLRAPDGCPWDREQTHQTLKKYVLEEAYEVADTLDEGDTDHLAEELGDLLLQVYLHAEIGRQSDEFTLGDVFEHINRKLIRRHPHVFSDVKVRSAEHVKQNWETIKKGERKAKGENVESESILRKIPVHTPALEFAQILQGYLVKAGFKWPDARASLSKISEEVQELGKAVSIDEKEDEFGDLLFAIMSYAQMLDINGEYALRKANLKVQHRFHTMEQICRERKLSFADLTDREKLDLWDEVKERPAKF